MKKIIYALFGAALIIGCATTSTVPTESKALTNSSRFPDLTDEDRMKGYKLFVWNCAGCHPLHRPTEFTEQQWSTILPVMTDRAYLSVTDRDLIFQYIVTEIERKAQNTKP